MTETLTSPVVRRVDASNDAFPDEGRAHTSTCSNAALRAVVNARRTAREASSSRCASSTTSNIGRSDVTASSRSINAD